MEECVVILNGTCGDFVISHPAQYFALSYADVTAQATLAHAYFPAFDSAAQGAYAIPCLLLNLLHIEIADR